MARKHVTFLNVPPTVFSYENPEYDVFGRDFDRDDVVVSFDTVTQNNTEINGYTSIEDVQHADEEYKRLDEMFAHVALRNHLRRCGRAHVSPFVIPRVSCEEYALYRYLTKIFVMRQIKNKIHPRYLFKNNF